MAEIIPFVPDQDNTCEWKKQAAMPYIFQPLHYCSSIPVAKILAHMTIYVNNKTIDVGETATVESILTLMEISTKKGIALAVNSNVIPSASWPAHKLNNGDKIMIIKATQGG